MRVAKVLLDFGRPRTGQARLAESLGRPVLRQLRDWFVARLASRVLAQPLERSRIASAVDPRVKERLEAAEQHVRHIDVRQHQPAGEFAGSTLVAFRADEDLQVLLDPGVRGGREFRRELLAHDPRIRFEALVDVRLEVANFRVVPVDAEVGSDLRGVPGEQFEQRLRVCVALGDPGSFCSLRGRGERHDRHGGRFPDRSQHLVIPPGRAVTGRPQARRREARIMQGRGPERDSSRRVACTGRRILSPLLVADENSPDEWQGRRTEI